MKGLSSMISEVLCSTDFVDHFTKQFVSILDDVKRNSFLSAHQTIDFHHSRWNRRMTTDSFAWNDGEEKEMRIEVKFGSVSIHSDWCLIFILEVFAQHKSTPSCLSIDRWKSDRPLWRSGNSNWIEKINETMPSLSRFHLVSLSEVLKYPPSRLWWWKWSDNSLRSITIKTSAALGRKPPSADVSPSLSLFLFTDEQENVFDRDEDDQQWMNWFGLCFHSDPREMIERFVSRWMEKNMVNPSSRGGAERHGMMLKKDLIIFEEVSRRREKKW
jgi:hypothetical protein